MQEIAWASGKAPCPRALFRYPLARDSKQYSPNTVLVLSYFGSDIVCIYSLGGLIGLIAYLRLFRLHGVTTFSFIIRHSSQKSLLSLLVFNFVLMRKLIIPQLNVVTKSLRMSCKG